MAGWWAGGNRPLPPAEGRTPAGTAGTLGTGTHGCQAPVLAPTYGGPLAPRTRQAPGPPGSARLDTCHKEVGTILEHGR